MLSKTCLLLTLLITIFLNSVKSLDRNNENLSLESIFKQTGTLNDLLLMFTKRRKLGKETAELRASTLFNSMEYISLGRVHKALNKLLPKNLLKNFFLNSSQIPTVL